MVSWIEYLRVIVVGTCAYAWLIFVLRMTGKRALAKLNAFDFAVTVAFGSALATVILDDSIGLLEGGLALALLAALQFAVSKLSLWSPAIRTTVRSRPTLLVRDGQPYGEALKYERITIDELAEAIRKEGVGSLEDVGAVILETNGSFSVLTGDSSDFDLLYDVRTIGEPSRDIIRERRRSVADSADRAPVADESTEKA